MGYDRATLTGISDAAGVSKGALSFHFASKAELANAVQATAHALTLDRVDQVHRGSAQPLQAAVDITLEMADLLESSSLARASLRLARERGYQAWNTPGWHSVWAPRVAVLLDQAEAENLLHAQVDVQNLAVLMGCVLSGMELMVRHRDQLAEVLPSAVPEVLRESAQDWMARIWRSVLPQTAISPVLPGAAGDEPGAGGPERPASRPDPLDGPGPWPGTGSG